MYVTVVGRSINTITTPTTMPTSRSVEWPSPPSTPADRIWESRLEMVLAIYDLLEALGADALPAWEQHHITRGMRPMHRACAFRRLLDEDAVPSLPQSEPE